MPRVFDYLDYRKFLTDAFQDRKARNRGFSHRLIANKLGLNSPGFFLRVLQNKKKLPLNLVSKVADLFKLDKREAEYLELLVRYTHANTSSEKQQYYEQIASFIKSRVKLVGPDRYAYFGKWYYTVVREIISICRFKNDFKKLAAMVMPNITPSEARAAVKLLHKMGFIKKNDAGHYQATDAILTAGENWQSEAIRNLQFDLLDLAKDAVHHIPRNERDVSFVTAGLSRKSFALIQEKIARMRREILEIAKNDTNEEGVYQYNFQVFPVAKIRRKKDGHGEG